MTAAQLKQFTIGLDSPGIWAAATKSDSTDDPAGAFVAVFNGDTSAGDVKVTQLDGTTFTIKNLPAGQIFPILGVRVWSTGTGLTNIGIRV